MCCKTCVMKYSRFFGDGANARIHKRRGINVTVVKIYAPQTRAHSLSCSLFVKCRSKIRSLLQFKRHAIGVITLIQPFFPIFVDQFGRYLSYREVIGITMERRLYEINKTEIKQRDKIFSINRFFIQ